MVNIKLRHNYHGAEASVEYGNTLDKDSGLFTASLVFGVGDENTNVTGTMNYYHRNSIANRDRGFSAKPAFLSSNTSPYNLQLSSDIAGAAGGLNLNPGGTEFATAPDFTHGLAPASTYIYDATTRVRSGGGLLPGFDFNQFSLSFPESERYGGYADVNHKIFGEQMVGYADVFYQNVLTHNELAAPATGSFETKGQTTLAIPPRVPLNGVTPPNTPTFDETGLPVDAFNPFNPFDQDIANGTRLRLAEFGNRIQRNATGAGVVALGVKGENVAEKWNFDASFSYSEIRDRSRQTHVSASRFNEIVDANAEIFRPGSARYVGTTTPYNPFGYYRTPVAGNAALVEYARVDTESISESALGQVSFAASTDDLIRLPHGNVGLAFGGDFRREQLDQDADPLEVAGDLVGQSPRSTTSAQRKIGGAFVEARIPVWRHVELSGSVRHEKFFSSHRETTVPKFAVRYQPFDRQLTVRSSYSRGFREPSLFELYSSPIFALTPIQDPLNNLFGFGSGKP